MKTNILQRLLGPGFVILMVAGLIAAGVMRDRWWPQVSAVVDRVVGKPAASEAEEGHDDHDAPGHVEHAAHEEAAGGVEQSLELSPQAMKNLGLTPEYLKPIKLSTFRKTISVPALIVERPGQTVVQVSTPMTGVVTEVAATQGAAVEPGKLLFRVRLTHEDLVQSQIEFVKALGELDVEDDEIKRLTPISADTPKPLLERKYAKKRLEAMLQAQREALRLHGLSIRQVDQIAKERRLLSELSIMAPASNGESKELQLANEIQLQPVSLIKQTEGTEPQPAPATATRLPLIVEQLNVHRGQSIEQGGQLCVLADYSRLYIEGRAFEQDSEAINKAVSQDWKIAAAFAGGSVIEDLPLSFVSSEIDPDSRTLKFYVDLPNEIVRDTVNAEQQRFISWKYKPGQRLQLRVPVEELPKQIVLPVEAIAQEGAESFVFQRDGKTFNRVAVHVLHRDQTSVVIANDGAVFPGDVVALRSAHQIQMAIKNKSGGAIDPHAGHSH